MGVRTVSTITASGICASPSFKRSLAERVRNGTALAGSRIPTWQKAGSGDAYSYAQGRAPYAVEGREKVRGEHFRGAHKDREEERRRCPDQEGRRASVGRDQEQQGHAEHAQQHGHRAPAADRGSPEAA